MATNEVWRDAEGNDQDQTEWHRVVLWGKSAEFATNYIKKGQLVYVEGRLQTRTWEDKNKVERRTGTAGRQRYPVLIKAAQNPARCAPVGSGVPFTKLEVLPGSG
jgi:single stranded DNA-binding protein